MTLLHCYFDQPLHICQRFFPALCTCKVVLFFFLHKYFVFKGLFIYSNSYFSGKGLVSIQGKSHQEIVQGVHELYDLEETAIEWKEDEKRTNRFIPRVRE